MKFYHLTFLSKNKNSLQRNFLFFMITSNLNFAVVKKYFQKKTKKQFITILKSPHVNKSAQEQFVSHKFSKQLTIFSSKNFQYTYLLKQIKSNMFSDINLRVKCSLNKQKDTSTKLQIFNPDNFHLNLNENIFNQKKILSRTITPQKNFQINKVKKIKTFLKTLDIYGELVKISLDSSVGRAKD